MHQISIPTGPRNPNGHTEQQILDGLRGIDGSRLLTFRYELLDLNNTKIADLEQVQNCTIEQNWLADIKRKAVLRLRSEGNINFLTDRIKPWVRLHLPPYGDDDWVEWPQGVFLLQSPARGTDASQVVARNVTGYDQLQIYLDDVIAHRFAVEAGTLYTQAVLELLTTTATVVANDLFDRVASTSWADADRGGTWSAEVDAATLSVSGGRGRIESTGGTHYMVLDQVVAADVELLCQVESSNASGFTGMIARIGADPTDNYGVAIEGTTGDLEIYRNQSGATLLATTGLTGWTANTPWWIRFRLQGSTLSAKAWKDGDPEPSSWQITATDTAHKTGAVGCQRVDAGTGSYDRFSAVDLFRGVQLEHSDRTLPTTLEWEPGTPKLRIINDLLGRINYESLSFDGDGRAVIQPYVSPQERHPAYVYADDEVSVMYPEVEQELDLFEVANRWVLVVSEPDRDPITAVYTNNDPSSPTSTIRRGRTITDFRTEIDAADQTTLDAKVTRLAFEASQIFEAIEFTTALMPFHDGNDVYRIEYNPLAINAKYSEHVWSMALVAGAEMTHRARRVVNV